MRRAIFLFLIVLFVFSSDYNPEVVKKVEIKLQKIKNAKDRSFKWLYSKKEEFTTEEINSYVNYYLERRHGDIIFRGAKIFFKRGEIFLTGALIFKKPPPGFEITPMGAQIIPLSLRFSLVQTGRKYKIYLKEGFLGRAKASPGLFKKILPLLKQSTGFNFSENKWEELPYGIKKVEVEEGRIKVLY